MRPRGALGMTKARETTITVEADVGVVEARLDQSGNWRIAYPWGSEYELFYGTALQVRARMLRRV